MRTRPGLSRNTVALVILTLVVISGVVGYYVLTQVPTPSVVSSTSAPAAQPNVVDQLANVSLAALNKVGPGGPSVTSPKSVNSSALLTLDGKPEVLYIGGEYCPFCAAERWALIVALDKFGSFSGIQLSQSAGAPEVYPNTPTFTFRNASYTSSYISFVSLEQTDRNHNALQTATANETSLMHLYDTQQAIPFVDIANRYVQVGTQYSPSVLANANWTQIASQLNNSSSTYAANIDAAANRLISAICKVDGGSPTGICSQSLAQTLAYVRSPTSLPTQLLASDIILNGESHASALGWALPSQGKIPFGQNY
jgi:hypothetical protein